MIITYTFNGQGREVKRFEQISNRYLPLNAKRLAFSIDSWSVLLSGLFNTDTNSNAIIESMRLPTYLLEKSILHTRR